MDTMLGFDLLRLDGYLATHINEDDGRLYISVTPYEIAIPDCSCENPDVVKHGKRVVHFRDHPIQRQETYLKIERQRYRCRSCASILLVGLPFIDEKRRMTTRFRDQLAKDGTDMKFSMAGEVNGVKESLVRRVFKEHAVVRLENYTYALPRVMGMDEKVLGGAARFVVGDVEKRVLLDICMSRKQESLENYFRQWHHLDRANVEVITQDMYWGYKTLNERYFRNATIVVDKFHVLRYADYAVSTVRKMVQSSLDNKGRVAMKNKISLLQARPDRLTAEGKWHLKRLFRQHPAIEQAVTFKEWFYDIYNADDRAIAEKAYDTWLELLPKDMEKPFKPILSCMREKRWRKFIFNYFDHPFTNAYVEATNNLLDEISRGGRGYDLATLRAKALLKYGNVKPLVDIRDFSLKLGDPETDVIMSTNVGHGVDLSTFEYDLRAGMFW